MTNTEVIAGLSKLGLDTLFRLFNNASQQIMWQQEQQEQHNKEVEKLENSLIEFLIRKQLQEQIDAWEKQRDKDL